VTTKFRALLALAALLGMSAGYTPRASAASDFVLQCWYQPGVDSPEDCTWCNYACMGPEYVCCDPDGADAE
jgi:hypothetical protein